MATTASRQEIPVGETRLISDTRLWNLFAYSGYARIVAAKHNLVVPEFDLDALSDEELERRTRLMLDLAHLPPR
jgi:hypothetical protein